MEIETIDARGQSAGVNTAGTSSLKSERPKMLSGSNLFMVACCAAMFVGTGIYVAYAPADQSFVETMMVAVPLLGCLAMHFVLHRLMGRSCHGSSNAGGSK